MFKKILWISFECFVAAALVGGAIYFYRTTNPSANQQGGRKASVPYVTIKEIQRKSVPVSIESQGDTIANESVILTASAQEIVRVINFKEGEFVRKGTIIVELECDLEKAELKQAELTLAEAKREKERLETLFRANAISEKDFDTQRTQFDRAMIQVESTKTQLADRRVVVPFDGILGKRQISLGALVTPGTQITTLDDITQIKVDFTIPEKFLPKISSGQKFTATSIAYPGKKFEGVIQFKDVRLNGVTRSVEVRGIMPNPKDDKGNWMLRPGMLLLLTIELGVAEQIVIPEKAVQSLGEIHFIFIYDKKTGKVSRREITIGGRANGMVEILSGASAGEIYVDEGVSKLVDGIKVQIAGE